MSKKANQTIDLGFLGGQAPGARTDLSGLFAASVAAAGDMQQATLIKSDRLHDNPYQPRADMRDDALAELSAVIKSQGFQGVLVARPHPTEHGSYQLTAGHRRREAAKMAGLHALPVVVKELSDEEMVTLAITENIQREDLTPLEEGRIYLLMSDEMGYTHEQIAREVGRKRGYIENRIRVARAPRDVQELVLKKPDSLRAVATLIKVKDEEDRAEIISEMLAGTVTVEDLPGYIASQQALRHTQNALREVAAAIHRKRGGTSEEYEGIVPSAKSEEYAERLMATAAELQQTRSEEGSGGVAPFATQSERKGTSRAVSEERQMVRIGNAKLASVLRYLNTYSDSAANRMSVSEQERASLARIKTVVDELYNRFASGGQG